MHIHQGGDFRIGEDLRSLFLAVITCHAITENMDLTALTLKIQIYIFRIEFSSGISQCTEDASPVGIMSEDSCLGQGRTNHGFCQGSGIFLAGCMDHFGLEQRRCPFAVSCHFFARKVVISCNALQKLS